MQMQISGLIVCLLMHGQEVEQSLTPAADAEYLIRGMQAARMQLTSGVVTIRGTRDSFTDDAPNEQYQAPANSVCAFDWRTGNLRYDTSRTRPTSLFNSDEVNDATELGEVVRERESQMLVHRLNSVRTPELFAYYEGITGTEPGSRTESDTNVELFDHDSNAGDPLIVPHHCFDVRSAGLFNFWEFTGQVHLMGNTMPERFSQVCELDITIQNLLNRTVESVSRDGDFATIQFRGLTITIDEHNGFTPVTYFSDRIGDKVASSVRWQQQADVWVPTEFMIELLDFPEQDDFLRHTYTMEWSHVNSEIPAACFDFKTFPDVQEGTLVLDNRSGKPVRIGEWKDGTLSAFVDDRTMPVDVAEQPGLFRFLLIVNCAVLIVIGCVGLWYRQMRAKRLM